MGKRSTIKVSDVVQRANRMLEVTPDDWVGERHGIAALLNWILMETDQYNGFNYLASEFLPPDEQTAESVLKPGYDESRRRYSYRGK